MGRKLTGQRRGGRSPTARARRAAVSDPYRHLTDGDIDFAVGIGEAGLEQWDRSSAAYTECVVQINLLKAEQTRRRAK